MTAFVWEPPQRLFQKKKEYPPRGRTEIVVMTTAATTTDVIPDIADVVEEEEGRAPPSRPRRQPHQHRRPRRYYRGGGGHPVDNGWGVRTGTTMVTRHQPFHHDRGQRHPGAETELDLYRGILCLRFPRGGKYDCCCGDGITTSSWYTMHTTQALRLGREGRRLYNSWKGILG